MGRVEDMSEDVFNFASSISSSSRQGLVGEVSEWAPPIERDEISTHTQGGKRVRDRILRDGKWGMRTRSSAV